jgi:hypothetical protein
LTPLATIADYEDLITALVARVDDLGISRDTVDEIAGLSDHYTTKLLSLSDTRRPGARRLGVRSVSLRMLGPLLGALALKLVVVPDEEAFGRNRCRYIPRDKAHTTSAKARWSDPNRRSRRERRAASAATAASVDPQISMALQGNVSWRVDPLRSGRLVTSGTTRTARRAH